MYIQICNCTGEGPVQTCKLHGWVSIAETAEKILSLPNQSVGQSCAPTIHIQNCAPTMVSTKCLSCASKDREINTLGAYMTYLVAHSGCQCKYCLPAAQIATRFTNAMLRHDTYPAHSVLPNLATTLKADTLWK